MFQADILSCELLFNTSDSAYDEDIRRFQGCPTIAITKKGRIYAGWYSGGRCEPHIENYNVLVFSDDLGKTWSKPLLIIPSNKDALIQALDIQLWVSPEGKLYVFWVQNNVEVAQVGKRGKYVDGYLFNDVTHAEWAIVCDEPDSENPEFSHPKCLDKGFLRCKPLVLNNGRWINFNYSQDSTRYEYSVSDDKGKTYTHMLGAEKVPTPFDESMAYQKKDGSIRMLARTFVGELAECTSYDNGETWTKAVLSGIDSPNTRFFISRTPSGNVILINNDDRTYRCKMTVYLSEDDGETWKYKKCIDSRMHISYPDADFYDGKIYMVYDHDRVLDREILFLSFTEEDIKDPDCVLTPQIISKPALSVQEIEKSLQLNNNTD